MTEQKLVKPKLTSVMLAEKMLDIFTDHIGHDHGITKRDLFKTLFGKTYKTTSYEHFYKADQMRKALHHLRVHSNCFVTSYRDEETGEGMYAVISSTYEAEKYCSILTKNMKRMQFMKIRARRSVTQRWYMKKFEMNLGAK